MGLIRLLTLPFRLVAITLAIVLRTAFGIGFSYIFLRALHRSGELPPEPLGLAAMGLPESMFGLPIAYVGVVGLFGLFMLFAGGGSGSSSGHHHGHDGGFGDAGGGDGGE